MNSERKYKRGRGKTLPCSPRTGETEAGRVPDHSSLSPNVKPCFKQQCTLCTRDHTACTHFCCLQHSAHTACLPHNVYTLPAFTRCAHSPACLAHSVYTLPGFTQCAHIVIPVHIEHTLPFASHTVCILSHTAHTPAGLPHSVHAPACIQCAHTPGLHTVCTHSRSHTVPLARGAHTLAAAHLQSALAGTAPTARALSGPNKRLSRIRCTLHIPCARCRHSAAGDFL